MVQLFPLQSIWQIATVMLALLVCDSLRADGRIPDYLRDVRPILATHCFTCHGPDAGARQAGLRLDQSESARQKLESGATAINPENVGGSELLRRIESVDAETVMPPPSTRKTLTADEKKLLREWISSGAKFAEHWAYRAPTRPVPPATMDLTWSRNDVDAFVLARLESLQLKPAPEASKETLIRRVTLDLTGLPPTLPEVDAFLADSSPEAYEKVVDRLLASPHYGEKLAQDWLDLARFGDTSGYQDDNDRPNHPYRDAVIQAFNDNLPFDQFTVESLAGDLLPQPTISQRVLSGFNRLHRYNEEGGSDPEEFRMVYAVDRTNTTATTWMGVSFGCAQCHDHKYDPFTQREYYQVLAFFNSLQGEITVSKGPANPPQISVPDPRNQQRIDELTRRIAELELSLRTREQESAAALEKWLRQPLLTEADEESSEKIGAIGGTVARTTRRAFYADLKLGGELSLETPLRSTGRVMIVRAVNSSVEISHFSTTNGKGVPGVGWSVAEGPRFFAHLALSEGAVIQSNPIPGQIGVEYEWSCTYVPQSGRITLEMQLDGKPAGTTAQTLTADQRASGLNLDAFGISFRGLNDQDSPIELYFDDIEYTVADGTQRTEKFDHNPGWDGEGHQTDGHQFGYSKLATTKSPDSLSISQLLAVPAEKRTEQQTARLRQHYYREYVPEILELQQQLSGLRKEIETLELSAPLALVWQEMLTPRPTQILTRGDYQQPGELVERVVPAIFPSLPSDVPRNRLGFARWLVSGDHPLTSRVAVNRYWKQVFGAGLVRTPDDFGIRGELPTHPELLDWLAVEFQRDWDVKRLLRMLVTSATYRQSSETTRSLRERDPDNRWLARGARFRLSAEEIRDAALTSAGLLNRRIGGRSVFPYQPDHFYRDKEDDPNEWKWPVETGAELYRRGLYTFIRRTSPYPSFQTFDVSGRGECTIVRARTNTPLQALVTLNDPVFIEAARVLAERVLTESNGTTADRVEFVVRCVLSRRPKEAERTVLETLYQIERERFQADHEAAARVRAQGRAPQTADLDPVEVAAWTMVANALFNLDEAITRE
jgi:mono/diheme cytochrome c family protein